MDMADLLMRSTLDTFFKVGFGVHIGSLSGSNKEGAAFARAFDDASEQVSAREGEESHSGCFDNKYIRDIILNFVIAGRDTTAGTLSWFLYVLCRNQRIKGQDRAGSLSETLRLYPAVPIDAKYCFSDDTLPDGHAIRKGDMVNYQRTPYPMGRMTFLWETTPRVQA
ncbi:hypothetical protein GUJ93_ZPchr0004g39899 [Zizania palustris]|uniref:Cytochrome P450 n=1 Tax=Zizania palustris TaxID=103762 RepID=A0A8J5S6X1_ZIZPA|nr:hypothetical protein GUJ93_ZPchr0004g39899 [Zizania palustris]